MRQETPDGQRPVAALAGQRECGSSASSPACSTRPSFCHRSASARSPPSTASIPSCSPSTATRTRSTTSPAESTTGLFGGNSNWRGPVWFPLNFLIVKALQHFDAFYGDRFRVECPTGSGSLMSLSGVACDLSGRLTRLFLHDATGRRPVHGQAAKFRTDPAGAICCSSTSTSTATRVPGWGPATRPAGRRSSPGSSPRTPLNRGSEPPLPPMAPHRVRTGGWRGQARARTSCRQHVCSFVYGL